MTIATLNDVLLPALRDGYAVAGLVVLGWEDAETFVAAAEAVNAPVILQAGPGARRHTPVPVLGAMLRYVAEQARVPVVCHLDHGASVDEVSAAIEAGFSSVMIDGSALPLAENIELTAQATALAHRAGLSIEGELGAVGYAGDTTSIDNPSQPTDPAQARQFADATGVDALAISVGNTHLQRAARTEVDIATLHAIATQVTIPLVLHGASGIRHQQRRYLARYTPVCKLNIGTELRQSFGQGLRDYLSAHPDSFDRLEILSSLRPALLARVQRIIEDLQGHFRVPPALP